MYNRTLIVELPAPGFVFTGCLCLRQETGVNATSFANESQLP
jgi:hypothetical protein